MKGKFKVLVLSPDKEPEVREIRRENELETVQEIVGGYVEARYWNNGNGRTVILCDEDGRPKRKTFCMEIGPYEFVGTIILASQKGIELASLTQKQIEEFTAEWHKQHKKETKEND